MIPRAWVEQDGPPQASSEFVHTAKLAPYVAIDARRIGTALDSLGTVHREISQAHAVGIRAMFAVTLSRLAERLLRSETESYSRRIARSA